LVRRDLAQQVDQRLVGFARFLREARHGVAEVGAVELRGLVHGAGQEALAERAEGHEADAEFFQQSAGSPLLGLAPPQRIFALQRRHRLHRMRAADGVGAGFGQAEVLDLAFLDQAFTVPATSSIGTFGSTRCW
jgi:hypothetical protein